jgi:hypothetical protein
MLSLEVYGYTIIIIIIILYPIPPPPPPPPYKNSYEILDNQYLFVDGGPILSYSLSHGIRWFYPGANQHYHIEHHQQKHNTASERQSQMLTT